VAHRNDGVAILGVVGAVAVTTVKGPVRGVGHHIDTVHATIRGGSVLVILQYTPKNMADVRIQTGYVRGSDIFESASPLKRLVERLEVWDQLEKNISGLLSMGESTCRLSIRSTRKGGRRKYTTASHKKGIAQKERQPKQDWAKETSSNTLLGKREQLTLPAVIESAPEVQ